MSGINFIPEDYVNNRESQRANYFYIVLFVLVMVAIGSTFSVIKYKQKAVIKADALVNKKIKDAEIALAQLESLQKKKKEMMNTVLLSKELIEPIPRSTLLAFLTNNLPDQVSLTDVYLKQKELVVSSVKAPPKKTTTQYKDAKGNAAKVAVVVPARTPKKFDTEIEIQGAAPSNIEVAEFIANISNTCFFDSVLLVKSQDTKIEEADVLEFKLKAMLRKDALVDDSIVEMICQKAVAKKESESGLKSFVNSFFKR